ncbi:diguanylate cyclase domain-containing protein [Salipiger sp.]|uniref:diguanylate cyclase domain-containing protein n=1 Tax=Salipiger sp. TaxID=2078585 RepID=UPI003A96B0BF
MTFPLASLDILCPMHVLLDPGGRVRSVGPTMAKLFRDHDWKGEHFSTLVDIYRPHPVTQIVQLRDLVGRRLQMRMRNPRRTMLKGMSMPADAGGVLLNLGFGIKVVDAVRDYALTSTDFAVTDLAIDMLYLVEAKSAAMEASRTLNRRLQGAMLAAEQRAYTDTLTGLRNRRALNHVLDRLVRSGARFAVMNIDLDFFKQVNDTRGHAAGDRVLQVVARAMLDVMRKVDTVARVGGDEFVVLLEDVRDRGMLADLADRLIRRIEQPILVDGEDCKVSASIGIAMREPLENTPLTADDLLERADVALYSAKRKGRAQHAFFPQETLAAAERIHR